MYMIYVCIFIHKETLENLKFCGYTYKSIYEKAKNNEKKLDENNRIIIRDNIIIILNVIKVNLI